MTSPNAASSSGGLLRSVWKIAWPVMVGTALTQSLSIVDMGFIARLGTRPVAAAAAASSVVRLLNGVGTGIGTAVLALSARFFGAGDRTRAAAVARHGMGVAFLVATVLCGAAAAGSRTLVSIFSDEEIVVTLGASYLRFMLAGLVFLYVYLVVAGVFQASGDTRTPLAVVIVANLVNVGLDPVLIYGRFGLPRLGITGAGAASMVGHAAGAVLAVGLLARSKRSPLAAQDMKFRLRTPEVGLVRNIARIAAPASVQALTRPLSGMLLNFMVSLYGTIALAAFGIGLKLSMFSSVFMTGLTAASGTLVGRHLGRENIPAAIDTVRVTSIVGTITFVVVAAGYFVFARPLLSVFAPEPEVLHTAIRYLRILAPSLAALGLMAAFSGAFQGSGDTAPLMRTAFWANGPVKLGAAALLGFAWPARLYGIWTAIAVSIFVETLLLYAMYRSGRWFKRETVVWNG